VSFLKITKKYIYKDHYLAKHPYRQVSNTSLLTFSRNLGIQKFSGSTHKSSLGFSSGSIQTDTITTCRCQYESGSRKFLLWFAVCSRNLPSVSHDFQVGLLKDSNLSYQLNDMIKFLNTSYL